MARTRFRRSSFLIGVARAGRGVSVALLTRSVGLLLLLGRFFFLVLFHLFLLFLVALPLL